MVERSLDWMREAERDLVHARHDLASGFYNWACFSAQQAGEKAVKGVFQRLNREAWGHSVYDLLRALPRNHRASAELEEAALRLDKHYIPTRYPNAHPSGHAAPRYTEKEAQAAVKDARVILDFCRRLLRQTQPK